MEFAANSLGCTEHKMHILQVVPNVGRCRMGGFISSTLEQKAGEKEWILCFKKPTLCLLKLFLGHALHGFPHQFSFPLSLFGAIVYKKEERLE